MTRSPRQRLRSMITRRRDRRGVPDAHHAVNHPWHDLPAGHQGIGLR
jgi:hypothetical protein